MAYVATEDRDYTLNRYFLFEQPVKLNFYVGSRQLSAKFFNSSVCAPDFPLDGLKIKSENVSFRPYKILEAISLKVLRTLFYVMIMLQGTPRDIYRESVSLNIHVFIL